MRNPLSMKMGASMTSKAKRTLIVLATAAANLTAQTVPWELGHPDAKLLMGIDLKSLRESAVGQSLREQMKAQPAARPTPAPFQASFQAMALGIFNQIDRVFFSSPANATASAKNNPPFLLAVEGRFPTEQIKPFLQGTSRRYRTAEVYRTSKTDTTSVALLDGGTLLMGDEKSVLAAIDRRGRALPPASTLLARAQALASTRDIWIIADAPLSQFELASTSASNPLAAQFASQIKGVDLGVSMHDGVQFELNLATESDAVATQLSQLLSLQIQTSALAQSNQPGVAEMVRRLHVDADGNRMRVNLALTADEFAQQMRAAQAARAMAATTNPPPAARPVKPATPGKIVIYGLEGGPREIQTTH